MNDLISRQAAIAEFKHYALYDSNRTNAEWVRRIELVLETLPSAEKHGKWIDHVKDYWCSECGGRIQKEQAKRFSICPYCGARMETDE